VTQTPAATLDQDYAAAGFGGALSRGARPALILVDFARAYFDQECGLYAGVEPARDAAGRVLAAARAAGIPIVWTRVEYVAGDPQRDGGQFYRKVPALAAFDAGNPLADFTPELAPAEDETIVTKQYPSAFFGTDLADQLHALNVDTCLITGLSTSGCVRATTLDALCHGFVPLVVEDACGDRDRRVHDSNIFDMRSKYAEVLGSGAAIAYLQGLPASHGS
jgi:maleamate amidohydrolase